jgi:uncharacterized membrane protein
VRELVEKGLSNERIKALISYLGGWVTGIILLIIEKKSSYVRFHAIQSTMFFGSLTLIVMIIPKIFPFIFNWYLKIIIDYLYQLPVFIIWVLLMWKAYKGEKYKLPYFGEIAQKQLEKSNTYVS